MAEFRVSVTRKQRYVVTVDAPSEWDAINQAVALIKQPGNDARSIVIEENFVDVSTEVIPPVHLLVLVPKSHGHIVADLCDLCGSETVMGVNDYFLDEFQPNLLVCAECYDTDRESIRTRYEAWEANIPRPSIIHSPHPGHAPDQNH